jgi:hypothetical protein
MLDKYTRCGCSLRKEKYMLNTEMELLICTISYLRDEKEIARISMCVVLTRSSTTAQKTEYFSANFKNLYIMREFDHMQYTLKQEFFAYET